MERDILGIGTGHHGPNYGRAGEDEMAERLRTSFDQEAHRTIDVVAAGLNDVYERLVRDIDERSRTQELIDAAEYLIDKVRKGEATDGAIEWVEKAVKAHTRIHGRLYLHEPGEK